MKNKKGFTLVELLAVIAILAILVIIALPNVMGMFNNAKKSSFLTEIKRIYRGAEQEYVKDSIGTSGSKVYSKCKSGCTSMLDMDVRDDLEYYIEINNSGKVVKYYARDNSYQYKYDGEMEITDIEDADIISDVEEKNLVVIDSSGASTIGWLPPEGKFRVIHSSDGSIETFDVQEHFNIYNLTKSTYYYGGYFSNYLLKGKMDENGNYPNFQKYDGSDISSWNVSDAYIEDGRNMTPVSRQTYFLREIPTLYISHRIYYTGWGLGGSNPTIGTIFHFSVIPDLAFKAAGMISDGEERSRGVNTSINVTYSGGSFKVTPKNFFTNMDGYVFYNRVESEIVDKATYLGTPYYITIDGIMVKSKLTRSIYFGNGNHLNDMVFSYVNTENLYD